MSDHLTATCPDAQWKKVLWRSDKVVLENVKEDGHVTELMTRPLITKTVQLLAAQPGFYKLDLNDEHCHW